MSSDGSRAAFWAAMMLMSGTLTTLFAKVQFNIKAKGTAECSDAVRDDDDDDMYCRFQKPWFSVLEMKLAMSLCAPIFYGLGWGRPKVGEPGHAPTSDALKRVWLPAMLDLLNTVLGNIGLVWVSSSIYQMTRGSVVIFSAILSVQWLGKRLFKFHYLSILLVVVAVILVGIAGTQSGSGTGASAIEIIIGLLFILLAQLVTATQIICEEKLMTQLDLPPVCLVGFEGLWGLLYFAILAPILSSTPSSDSAISTVWHEDFIDSFVQLSHSSDLVWSVVGYFITILMYNVSCNFVTQTLSAVVRSILEACRTLGVWAAGIFLYYALHAKDIGEAWSSWSYLELGGFILLVYGTVGYKALVKFPCVSPEEYAAAEAEADKQADAEGDVTKGDYARLVEEGDGNGSIQRAEMQ